MKGVDFCWLRFHFHLGNSCFHRFASLIFIILLRSIVLLHYYF